VLFRRIDEKRNSSIDAVDLKLFLDQNNVEIALERIVPVVNHYSSKEDSKLRYSDFL
jgi:Ca2+-binding EF-hand superfamily protein